MDERNDIDRLLVSYLLKELTAEEEATVTETINSDPEFHRYFEEFKRLFRLLEIKQNIDGIDLEKERERFDKILSEKRNTSREITGEVYDIGQVEEKKRSRTYQLLRVAAVAALIAAATMALVIFTSIVFVHSASALAQAAMLLIELTAISALARWHSRSLGGAARHQHA